jgi:hypothetical protein
MFDPVLVESLSGCNIAARWAHSDFVGFWWQVKDSRRVDIHSELQEHSLGYQTRSLGDVRRIHRKPSGEVF